MAEQLGKDADLLNYLNQIDDEGVRSRSQWSNKWENNVKVMRGNGWPEGNQPLFASNIIAPAIRRKSGLLVESQPAIEVRSRKNGFEAAAQTLRMTIRAIWDEQSVSMGLEELSYFLSLFGSGFIEIGYDPFGDYGEGCITVSPKDPRLMIVDPAVVKSYQLDKAQYIREEMVVPMSWVQRRFPRTATQVQPDSSMNISGADQYKLTWVRRALNSMFKKGYDSGIDSAVPRVYIKRYWLADGQMDKETNALKYPGGRLVWRTGDDVILNPDVNSLELSDPYGQQNPYYDGLWPYEALDNEPDTDHMWGHSEVEGLKKLNEAFNRTGNTVVSTLIKNLEWVIADNNSLRPEDITDLKQLQAVVLEKQPGRSVERVPPTQPSATNMDFMRFMISLVEMQEGLSDGSMQGKGRIELRSQPQLEGLQQVSQVLIRAQARRLERCLERVGQKLISRIFQFYTDDRILSYVDKDQLKQYEFKKDDLRKEIIEQARSAKEEEARQETEDKLEDGKSPESAFTKVEELSPEEITEAVRGGWRLFRFKIVPFSSLASNRMARAAVMEQLAQQQLIPPSMILEEAGFDNYIELLKKFKEDLDARAAVGLPPPQPPDKKGGGGKKK